MAEPPCPWDLSWADVDPMLHPFDPATVEAVVAGLPPAAEVPPRPAVKRSSTALQDWGFAVARPWVDRMSGALVDRYGGWASGWRWSQSDGDWPGGGPVGVW